MNNMAISNNQIVSVASLREGQTNTKSAKGFSDVLFNAVKEVNNLHQTADKAIQNVQAGNTGGLHEAMIALEKADVSFRTMLTVRNKLIEAYQEIMRMQV
ncbi:MAG: flagellar hook-basal body complex protein FliE [Deltaproteobacteria bacterium]|nr:flagellar hook-basal body complex protein FliE [Deltaproteobacteria bacterium]